MCFSIVSLIATVPVSECRIPTLIVSSAAALCATFPNRNADTTVAYSQECRIVLICFLHRKVRIDPLNHAGRHTAPAGPKDALRQHSRREPHWENAMAP